MTLHSSSNCTERRPISLTLNEAYKKKNFIEKLLTNIGMT